MRVLLDVTRTLKNVFKPTLTGIERVELAYIEYFLSSKHDVYFVATLDGWHGALSKDEMRKALLKLRSHSPETATTEPRFPQMAEVVNSAFNATRSAPLRIIAASQKTHKKRALLNLKWLIALKRRRFSKLLTEDGLKIYIHTSHTELDNASHYEWLRNDDVRSIFFVHDLIPIEFPEFCTPGSYDKHAVRMKTISKFADVAVVNSEYTKTALESFFASCGWPIIPTVVSYLANEVSDRVANQNHALSFPFEYFVHVGTLEARKNVGQLLNSWRELIDELGPELAPKLILVGKRGWICDQVFAMLDRSRTLANHVVEMSGISDSDLVGLLKGSRGLVTLSSVEGYGLPPVEALKYGVQVIASDIPAHREILPEDVIFVGPTDGRALKTAVKSLLRNEKTAVSQIPTITWNDHVEHAFQSALRVILSDLQISLDGKAYRDVG